MLTKRTPKEPIQISLSMDDFLVTAPTDDMLEKFREMLRKK